MKIKKTLFTKEIEFTPDELEALNHRSRNIQIGLFRWLEEIFGLDFRREILIPKKEEENVT